MEPDLNQFGQPVGTPVPGWTKRPPPPPPRTAIIGRFCTVEPLDPERHAAQLFTAFAEDDGRMWTYLPRGPFASAAEYREWTEGAVRLDDPLTHAIVDNVSGEAVGTAAYMRIDPAFGVIEVGSITYSPRLQRRPAGTEAMYLMMRRVFDELGYRRYEWKCNSLNMPSREAALRLGFQYEGLFRQATMTRGRNRDTTWFSVIDREWPVLRAGFERWLDPANFDAAGRQRRNLAGFRSPAP
jgi:RimJ/RimL family protein N-acetyltransferase